MTVRINPRFNAIPTNPFDRLRALLSGPGGGETLAMSVGEPQHTPPVFALDVLARESAGWRTYPPLTGTEEFREAVANWASRRFSLPAGALDPESAVLPVAGSREPLGQIAIVAASGETDGGVALIPDPAYQIYSGAAAIAGLRAHFVPALAENGFLVDYSKLPENVLKETRLAYLCSPANPQGAAASLELLVANIRTARQYGFILAVDECYSEIYFGAPPVGSLQAAASLPTPESGDLFENVIVFSSLSKRSSVPGFRSGYIAGDRKIIDAFRRFRAAGGVAVPTPILKASIALWHDEGHVELNRIQYQAKFDAAESILCGRFDFYRPAGGFFLWLNVGDGEKAALALWKKAGIRVLPGAYMASAENQNAAQPYIRVALVHELDITERALKRFVEILPEAQ